MAGFTIKIDSILGGRSPTQNYAGSGQFDSSIAVDPDFPIDDSTVRISGILRPTAMEKFSGSTITGAPLWFITNPKDTNIYCYASDGKLHSISSSLSMNSDPTAPTTASGNGGAYYDNYIYCAKNTDVYRYGPLNGSPSATQSYWTSTLAKTALTNTTYPSLRGVQIPNHPMHRHVDDKLYFGDVVGSGDGAYGVLHYIKTTKTSAEGDTDSGSVYNALDFDLGYFPTCLETYGTDLVVGLIEGVNTTVSQKPAVISFWDTTSVSFNKIVQTELPDPLITALKNVNGILYAWLGNASGGTRVIRFAGGYSWEEVAYIEDSLPPFQGAVDHDLNRIVWGGFTNYPENSSCVWAFGSKNRKLSMGVHNILKSTSATSTNQNTTALKYVLHASNSIKYPIVGWKDNSSQGADKISTSYKESVFRSETFRIGRNFQIKKITIPLIKTLASNMTITPTVYFDNLNSSLALTTVNSTNFSGNLATIYPNDARGSHSFVLQLRWSGTALAPVMLPITIEGEVEDSN